MIGPRLPSCCDRDISWNWPDPSWKRLAGEIFRSFAFAMAIRFYHHVPLCSPEEAWQNRDSNPFIFILPSGGQKSYPNPIIRFSRSIHIKLLDFKNPKKWRMGSPFCFFLSIILFIFFPPSCPSCGAVTLAKDKILDRGWRKGDQEGRGKRRIATRCNRINP